MTQYLLSNVTPAGVRPAPDDLQRVIADVIALRQEMQEAGVWVFAMPLTEPSSATVVRNGESGITLADGPFAETKEYIGGFTVIDVADLDAALAWAGKTARATRLAIEVRPGQALAG